MSKVRFCAFADIHYCPGVFPHDTYEWLDTVLQRAEKENVDFIIHLGDLTHRPLQYIDYVNHYNDFKIPTYHTIGNHDDDGNPHEVTLQCYRMERGYYFFDCKGFRFIVLDGNYYRHEGQYIHYSEGNYYAYPDERDWFPPEEMEWLKETVENSPYPCVTFCHESFEREADGIHNMEEIKQLLNDTNASHPGRVRLCINGHHHRDYVRLLDNIIYFELNSANYEWVSKPHDKYSPEFLAKYTHAKNTVTYNAPLSAIITLDDDGTIAVEGMKSTLLDNVTREMTGNPRLDAQARPVTATIQSFKMKMSY